VFGDLFKFFLELDLSDITGDLNEFTNRYEFLFVLGHGADPLLHGDVRVLNLVDVVVAPIFYRFNEFISDFERRLRQRVFNLSGLHSKHRGLNLVIRKIHYLLSRNVVDLDLLFDQFNRHLWPTFVLLVCKETVDKLVSFNIEQVLILFVLGQNLKWLHDIFVKHVCDFLSCVVHPWEVEINLEVWSARLLQA